MTDEYEHLTSTELAAAVYLGMVGLSDALTDSDYDLLPVREAAALWARLRPPECEVDGCRNQHMRSYPWCPWHRPESYGPLPAGYPDNPNPIEPAG